MPGRDLEDGDVSVFVYKDPQFYSVCLLWLEVTVVTKNNSEAFCQ